MRSFIANPITYIDYLGLNDQYFTDDDYYVYVDKDGIDTYTEVGTVPEYMDPGTTGYDNNNSINYDKELAKFFLNPNRAPQAPDSAVYTGTINFSHHGTLSPHGMSVDYSLLANADGTFRDGSVASIETFLKEYY